jgi:hypothetical protein
MLRTVEDERMEYVIRLEVHVAPCRGHRLVKLPSAGRNCLTSKLLPVAECRNFEGQARQTAEGKQPIVPQKNIGMSARLPSLHGDRPAIVSYFKRRPPML